MSEPAKVGWRKRAEDNASFKFHLSEWIYLRRAVGKIDARAWATRAARAYPMSKFPDIKDRIGRVFDWIIARTEPRKGQETTADRNSTMRKQRRRQHDTRM